MNHPTTLCKRVVLQVDPYVEPVRHSYDPDTWKAKWIGPEHVDRDQPVVLAFRCQFNVTEDKLAGRIHLAADQRYDLFVDGERLGWGSERGDDRNWFYDSYDMALTPGPHTLVVRVAWWSDGWFCACGQHTHRPAMLLMAEDAWHERLSSGAADWHYKTLGGYAFHRMVVPDAFMVVPGGTRVDGRTFDWGYELGRGESWLAAPVLDPAILRREGIHFGPSWVLRHAILPAMRDEPIRLGKVRHVHHPTDGDPGEQPIDESNQLSSQATDWQAMLDGNAPVTIGPRERIRVIVDMQNYHCGFLELIATGGKNATLRAHFAESLFEKTRGNFKGKRDEIHGKYFRGVGDTFVADGGQRRRFENLWWQAGRYVELVIQTEEAPLTLESLQLRDTHYPWAFDFQFDSSDPRLGEIIPLAMRTLCMCSHETYMDCPYYEQLMYVGDTRLQVLVSYVTAADDRLPRKAMLMFDESRTPDGLTRSRHPSRVRQTIPPFSLWWVAMVHDFAHWRDDPAFVAERMPGVRAVLQAYQNFQREDGIITRPNGWNFVDWVSGAATGWAKGMPPGADESINATINLHAAMVFRMGADLERIADEPALAARYLQIADRITQATQRIFWDESQQLFAEDQAHEHFSEHAQCLAVLGDSMPPPPEQKTALIRRMLRRDDLAKTTIYFTHYLFEALAMTGRMDEFFQRMNLWFDHTTMGMKTTREQPEPSRSDCHAWGAHPVYHYFASVLGVRPASPGFKTVTIHPQLGPLSHAEGRMVHPQGHIRVQLQQQDGHYTGRIELPGKVTGRLIANGQTFALGPGENRIV